MKRGVFAVLILCLILSFCACEKKSELPVDSSIASEPEESEKDSSTFTDKQEEASSETQESQKEASEESSEEPAEDPKEDPVEGPMEETMDDPSLVSLRQAMVGTPEMYAISYFGFFEGELSSLSEWMKEAAPDLAADLPFIEQIPLDHVIGQQGEVYCIVPADEGATIAVNTLAQDIHGNLVTDEVLYRSEYGDPIIVICGYGGFSPDREVNITDSTGESITLYPCLDENGYCQVTISDAGDFKGFDFTNYAEIYNIYHGWRVYGWLPPLKAGLDDTSWSYETTGEDGTDVGLHMDLFADGTMNFYWLLDGEDRTFQGTWGVEEYGDAALLTLDATDGNEVFYEQFPVLINQSGNNLILFTGLEGTYLPIENYDVDITAIFDYSVG